MSEIARLETMRRKVTKERLGFGADADQLPAATYEAHLIEAQTRISAEKIDLAFERFQTSTCLISEGSYAAAVVELNEAISALGTPSLDPELSRELAALVEICDRKARP